jgi:hypothetical protein
MAEIQKTTAPVVTTDAAQAAHQRAAENQKAKEEREAKAAGSGSVTLIATVDFTIVSDPAKPEGKVIRAGQEFTVAKADLPRFEGRGRPKNAEDGSED